ncbi:MAG: hypothetical protein D6722_29150, partial [Bacteroidetes bacterium]
MNRAIRLCPFLVFFLGALSWLPAQNVTVDANSPFDQYVYNIQGTGVIISNVNINCDTVPSTGGFNPHTYPQMGGFNGVGTSVLDSGLLLTSGSADYAVPGLQTGVGLGIGSPGDADMVTLLTPNNPPPVVTNDACAVTFDAVASCDTIRISYVFASNEYPTFVGAFDDAFGAFVTGPGYPTPTNFALVPGTTLYPSVNNVNDATNNAYYIGPTGFGAPSGTDYDGQTVALEAKIPVIPNTSYTIKLVVVDEGDQAYDSGVFIESVFCDAVCRDGVARNDNNPNSNQVVEGCVDGYFTVFNDVDTTQLLNATFTLGGTATPGIDYTFPITGPITFQPGQDSINIPVSIILDGALEGPETIQLIVSGVSCFGGDDTIEMVILDPFSTAGGPDTSFCSGEPGIIGLPALPNVTYSWSSALGMQGPLTRATPTVQLTTPIPQTIGYVLTATDINGCAASDTVNVSFTPPPPVAFSLPTAACVDEVVTVTYAAPPLPGANFLWDFGGNTSSVIGSGGGPYQITWGNAGPQQISLVVEEGGCRSDTLTKTININPIPTSSFLVNSPVCEGEFTQLVYTGTGNAGATYIWDLDGGLPAVQGPGPHTVSWSTDGPKTVTLQVIQAGCVSPVSSQPVTVFPTPTPTFATQSQVCQDDLVQITYTGSAAG